MTTVSAKEQTLKREKAEYGFWLYLMTDLILFASLFATYMILRNNTANGGTAAELFDPGYALVLTVILLLSSFTSGVAAVAFRFNMKRLGIGLLTGTIILGAAFLALEIMEFTALVAEGESWRRSAFLSGFFTLVGTHGLHILIGLLWAASLGWYIAVHGITANALRKFSLFTYFWHFLDIVWIFIFTIVYLGGVL